MQMAPLQLRKEVRQIIWPWAMLMMGGVLVLILPREVGAASVQQEIWAKVVDFLLPAGTFAGTVFIAALVLGSEFQHRTISMRLAQPIPRVQFWQEKLALTTLAVIPVTTLYAMALGFQPDRIVVLAAISWGALVVAGSLPMALLSRSIIGTIALTTVVAAPAGGVWAYLDVHGYTSKLAFGIAGLILTAYAAGLVWLGRWMTLRFQSADGMQVAGFVPGAQLVPKSLLNLLTCRPTQPVLNLFRTELRLLRSLWPLAGLVTLAWTLVSAFRWVPEGVWIPSKFGEVAYGLTLTFSLLVNVLAGAMSLGEEKTWGTHSWNMTLPISVTTQWFIKWLVGTVTAVIVCAALPILILVIGGAARGNVWLMMSPAWAIQSPIIVAVIASAAFWCSCVVKNTVRAVGWLLPIIFGIGVLAPVGGSLLIDSLSKSPLNLVGWFVDHLDVMSFSGRYAYFELWFRNQKTIVAMAILITIGAVLIQSGRLFRREAEDSNLRVMKTALPLLVVTLLMGIASSLLERVAIIAWRKQDNTIWETHAALAQLPLQGKPMRLSGDDPSLQVSVATRSWLHGADIVITPAEVVDPTEPYYWRKYWGMDWANNAGALKANPYWALINGVRGNRTCVLAGVYTKNYGNAALHYGVYSGTARYHCD